jgi:two-component system sensor histidine kinase KdpD
MSFLLQPRRTIHPMDSRRWIWIIRWLLAFSALAGIVLVYRSWLHVNPTTVALTLLLYILLLAAEWGLRYAVLISIAAAVCYNFFFLPPVGTLTISDPQNWLALLAFLVTAILASRLSELARDEATEARTKQRELEVLFRLSRELLQSESVAALLSSVPAAVVSVTAAEAGMLYLLEGDRVYQAEMSGVSERDFPYLRRLATSLPGIVSDGEQMQIPLRTGLRPTGVLLLRRVALSDETAEAIGRVISISIDRAEALEGLARGEAAKESELTGDIQPLEAKELLTIIDEESDRLNRLVSEAVQMAQLDAQQVKMHFGPVAVRDLIDAARDACSWVGEEHLLHFEMPKSLEVRGDAGVLQKVISNLLENAAKYSSPGTPITISSERRNDTVAISVADRGIGIDASEQALIFERSYRAGSQAHQSAGTGMGLAIGRAIAIAHGGNIEVTSQLGRGSVFTLTLPAFSGSLDSTRQTTLQESGEL